ncbi:DUF2703 domain-containing protein [Synechococcales cyanobacterium C]|uniref:DUF2703 domain-containing protein n=1 Tax=Petrachloros mirabilis ULC683 TaxID=2781853 RepID=A0A8K2A151_9CYAN|nr:DUF2703 domain-containing protein [Petrachloros mirabilis]NCJ07888.1 DUF2703 domain-containing protein [Petrachloros mirabilis ULC683]
MNFRIMNSQPPQRIEIELLALDLKTCTRCAGSLANIHQAIALLQEILKATGVTVSVTQQLIESEEQARQQQFVASPTIRINGMDIALEMVESPCDTCSDLCGCNGGVACRVWHYRGEEYTEAPVGMIVDAILASIYADTLAMPVVPPLYAGVPDNLRQFFAGRHSQSITPDEPAFSCCDVSEEATCCEAEEKAECCGTVTALPASCGCR